MDNIQAEPSDMPEPAPQDEEQDTLTEAEKAARLDGVLLALQPANRHPDDLTRARAAWFNATATVAPGFLIDDHYLAPRFIESMFSLRDAASYDDIADVVASLRKEFSPYSTIRTESTLMDLDADGTKRPRDLSSPTEDMQQDKRARGEAEEGTVPPLRMYAWDEVAEPGQPSSSISSGVDDFLDYFEQCISGIGGMLHPEAAARGYFPATALWVPKPDPAGWTANQCARFAEMRIPKLPVLDGPDLLLYLLGELETLDKDIALRLRALEQSPLECFLNNAAGSGKTRLLFELSCKIWTFYFTLDWHPSTNPYGSRDLDDAYQMIIDAHRLGPNGNPFQSVIVDYEPSSPSLQADVTRWFREWDNNTTIADHVYQLVFLARLLIYQRFRRLVADIPENDAKRAWCLLQICPSFSGMQSDVFCTLLGKLAHLSRESAQTEIQRLLDELDASGEFPDALIFDEAQAAAQKCPTAFGRTLNAAEVDTLGRSYAGSSAELSGRPRFDKHCRPLLKPLVNSFRKHIVGYSGRCKTFIAGTKLHHTLVSEALSSSLGKPVAVDEFVEFGEQDDPEKIRTVLDHFFGRAVVNKITRSMWEELNYWLQGRHRFIAIFVFGVLMSGRHPDQMMNVLSNMLKKLTGHALLGQKHRNLAFLNVDSIAPRFITDPSSISEGLRNLLSNSILEFIVKGKTLRWASGEQDLVTLGVGRFEAETTKEKKSIVINEHLVLVTLFHWLHGDATYSPLRSWLDLHMADSHRSNAGFGFEDVTLFLFWDWFSGDGRRLSDIFDFRSRPAPAWAGEKAQLISVFRANASDGETHLVHKLHTSGLSYAANTADDTLNWFFGNTRCPILKPDLNFGADVVFGLRLESGVEILVCVQCKFWSSIHHKGEIEKELWKLSPEGFYKGSVASDLSEKLGRVLHMFRAKTAFVQKPHPGTPSHPDVVSYDPYPAKYRVLRVLAAFKDTIKVPQEVFETAAIGCYPFALLSSSAMLAGSGHFSSFKRAVKKAEEAEEAARQAEEQARQLDAARNAAQIAKDAEKDLRRSGRNKK